MRVTSKGLRDLFFLLVGTAVLFHEIWQRSDPSPLGVFVALFLFGLIPAFRADEGSTQGPLGLLMSALAALGGKGNRATLAEQEARVELAEQVARDRAAVRAAMAERAAAEDQQRKTSPPESSEPDSR